MFKNIDNYVLRETCGYCAQSHHFKPEHFAMCNECHTIYCSIKCIKKCQCGKNVCPICAEEIRKKYGTYELMCGECAKERSKKIKL